jgi:hypothetical protein
MSDMLMRNDIYNDVKDFNSNKYMKICCSTGSKVKRNLDASCPRIDFLYYICNLIPNLCFCRICCTGTQEIKRVWYSAS